MDLPLPINLADPFHLHFECVYALVNLVFGLVCIYHLDLSPLPNLIVTLLFLMYWIDLHFSESEW